MFKYLAFKHFFYPTEIRLCVFSKIVTAFQTLKWNYPFRVQLKSVKSPLPFYGALLIQSQNYIIMPALCERP